MKSAIYMADGITQVVLTPENEMDKAVLTQIEQAEGHVRIKRGDFYECRGGYVREGSTPSSLMLVVRSPEGPADDVPQDGFHDA